MNIENSKIIQPSDVTESLRDQYKSLSLTDGQAREILANATTRVIMKPNQFDGCPADAQD